MVIVRERPDDGVPATPYSVSPVTLNAISATLAAIVVGFAMQLTLTS